MAGFEQLKWMVAHDPCRVGDRNPCGAVPVGSTVNLLLRVDQAARENLALVSLLFGSHEPDVPGYVWAEVPLRETAEGFVVEMVLGGTPRVYKYAFLLETNRGQIAYYVPRADGRATAGELVVPGPDGEWTPDGWVWDEDRLDADSMQEFGLDNPPNGFQLTVYEPAFQTPSWMAGAIMYQIFPDRFARGPQGVLHEGVEYHEHMGRPVRLHENWEEPVEWLGPEMELSTEENGNLSELDGDDEADEPLSELEIRMSSYDPIDFFGGTLEGIRCKLPYLASLGVEVVYLNPVFEARSNHRYDTADYECIDPLLGSEEDLRALVRSADELGISIMLDAVLSHTGSDSRYFNALDAYTDLGAIQSESSPYYSWYDFKHPSGEASYRCWWGFPTLPEVNEHDPSWQAYILGPGGILEQWLSAGVRGYRLDVADELPDDVLEHVRRCVKGTKADAGIIGEVWEDPTTKESYGESRTYALGSALDSVMNYPLRAALLGFALGNIDARQLATFLKRQQLNFPPQMHRCLMNLLGSHDTERMRSALVLGVPLRHLSRDDQHEKVAGVTADQDHHAAHLQQMVVGLLYALPGMPCVYYGDELGMQGGGDPFCRATFPTSSQKMHYRSDCGEDLTAFYQEIGQLRKLSPALRTGLLACTAPHSDVLCVVRAEDGSLVVAATNRSLRPQTVAFDACAPELCIPEFVQSTLCQHIDAQPLFGDVNPLRCEAGVICLTVPPESTAYWKLV